MVDQLLRTKLFIPPPLPHLVHRPVLLAHLNQSLQRGRKLTLVSAAAGFGKTRLLAQWVADLPQPVAWLTLDERDGDAARFLAYIVAALRTILPEVGHEVSDALQSRQPPPVEQLLTTLLNELADVPDKFILVIDDYHEVDAQPVDAALNFLLDHLPPQMHLAIATREDPPLPLARLRERIRAFLMQTSILDRMCGPLCEAVTGAGAGSGQESLDDLVKANLFVIPLDNERGWYRYHRLFADLLQQRLRQNSALPAGTTSDDLSEYHARAGQWYEENGWPFEAFRHAAAANDIERAERLIGSRDMPLHFRGTTTAILDWLASLPPSILDERPSLRVSSATIAFLAGQTDGVDEKLQTAEAAVARADLEDKTRRSLTGKIAAARATLALTRYQPETIVVQAQRALAYLPADDLPFRFAAYWTLGFAHYLQGNRAAAGDAYTEAIALGQRSGDVFSTILATDSLGQLQEQENQLHQAADSYRRVLSLAGAHPHPL